MRDFLTMTISQSARHGQLPPQGCVIIWQANEGDHAGPLHNIMSAKQLRHFSQVRDHLVRDSAPGGSFSLGTVKKRRRLFWASNRPELCEDGERVAAAVTVLDMGPS